MSIYIVYERCSEILTYFYFYSYSLESSQSELMQMMTRDYSRYEACQMTSGDVQTY